MQKLKIFKKDLFEKEELKNYGLRKRIFENAL